MFQAIVPMEKREDFPQTPEVLELLQRVFDLCKRLNDARQELVEEAKKEVVSLAVAATKKILSQQGDKMSDNDTIKEIGSVN